MKKLCFKIINGILVFLVSAFVLSFLCFVPSCSSNSGSAANADLSDILKTYRDNGMTSWWEIAAVYNAGGNPLDSGAYKGFDEILASLEGTSNIKMASYVIAADIAVVIINADEGYFEKYGEYKSKLKDLLENPSEDINLNDYIFAYYALKCSGTPFDPSEFYIYLESVQKSDGGFALSGDKGDVDMTAFVIQALKLYYKANPPGDDVDLDKSMLINAVKFLESKIKPNGVFTSSFNNQEDENANSTAVALSALISYYGDDESSDSNSNGIIKKASDGLALFRVKNEAGYMYLKGGKTDALATAQAAISLGDLKNKKSVWESLYDESLEVFEGQ